MDGKISKKVREQNRRRVTKALGSFSLDTLFDRGLDLPHNQIYLNGVDRGYEMDGGVENEVDFIMASQFAKNMMACQQENRGEPILIHLSTRGGDWDFGMQIYDVIKSSLNPITVIGYAHIQSMGSIILQAANWRVMMPHSNFLFHKPSYTVSGSENSVLSEVKFYERVGTPTMIRIYAERMQKKGKMAGKSFEEIGDWLRTQMDKQGDAFFTAKEAVNLGLADEIFQDWDNYLDLRNYHPIIPKNLAKERKAAKKPSTRSRR